MGPALVILGAGGLLRLLLHLCCQLWVCHMLGRKFGVGPAGCDIQGCLRVLRVIIIGLFRCESYTHGYPGPALNYKPRVVVSG